MPTFLSWLLRLGLCTAAFTAQASPPPTLSIPARDTLLHALAQQVPGLTAAQVRVEWLAARGAALQDCPSGWTVQPPRLAQLRRVTMAVRCGSARGSLTARVQVERMAWTVHQDLPTAHLLQPGDAQPQKHWMDTLERLPDATALPGSQLQRPLPAGSALHWRDLRQPTALHRGDKVEIRADSDGVTVSVQGVALGAARLGQRVQVRNARSQQLVEGVLIAPGIVQASGRKNPQTGVTIQAGPQSRD